MTNLLKHRWCSFAVLLSSVCFCLAQAPSGQVQFFFDTTNAPVWDLSGNLTFEQEMQGAGGQGIPIAFTALNITNDARGKVSSSGLIELQVGNDFVAAEYRLTGRTTGGGTTINRVSLNVRLTGEGVIAGVLTRFVVVINYKLEADAERLLLVGTARGSANFSGLSSARINSEVEVPFSPAMNGSWTLTMNILPLRKLVGSATVTLSSGRVLNMDLTGSYSPNTGVSRLNMRGVGDSKGTSVNLRMLTTEEEGNVIESLRANFLGQTVRQ
jgi:hypothetical protein